MIDSDALTFGKLVEKLIKDSGVSKTFAGKRLGLTDAAIHRLINDVSSPSINRALTVLDDYGYTLAVTRKDAELPDDAAFILFAETEAERKKKLGAVGESDE